MNNYKYPPFLGLVKPKWNALNKSRPYGTYKYFIVI